MLKTRPDSVLWEIVLKRQQSAAQIEVNQLPQRQRPYHSLKSAIRQQQFPAVILECKAASPSKGKLACDYDPAKLAQTYRKYGAVGISVLVEGDYFNGSYAHLQAVSETVDLPVLCKDFIVSRAQIAAAHAYGADVVLLMLQVLEDEEYRELADYASQLQLEVLTEVSTREECERANRLGADLIDVNHRDLHSLEIDLQRCSRLRPYISANTLVVAASGMGRRQELADIADCCDAYLVGSSLSGAPDLEFAIKQLFYGNIKICGLTNVEIAKHAASCGASYGGLIWHSTSPRQVDMVMSAKIIADTENRLRFLVVSREDNLQNLEKIATSAKAIGAWGIQLHAPRQENENEFANRLRAVIDPELMLVRAVSIDFPLAQLQELVENPALAWVIVDSPQPGSGQSWDWQKIPAALRQKIWVAGGISPDNIEFALQAGFAGYDINSGVERLGAAGPVKDPYLIENVFKKIRAYLSEKNYGNK